MATKPFNLIQTLGVTVGAVAAACAAVGILLTFQTPPVTTVQRGFRGVAMEENYDPLLVAKLAPNNIIPAGLSEGPVIGPKASAVYKNVQILGDLSVGQFTKTMLAMTTWVSPKQGCGYCHNLNNMASDEIYTKVVARRMVQMVQTVNSQWQTHVQATGVTCWTCHRGNPVPSQIWFENPGQSHFTGALLVGAKNAPSTAAGLASLPGDPFTPYLENAADIRVQGEEPLPDGNLHSIKQAEWTYGLMMHFANSLGVNCTYCHNSRAFGNWEQSTPQRVTAWYGIRMVRAINADYLGSLHGVFPAVRLGSQGDVAKVNCATCHQGVFKPLYGKSMLPEWPALAAPLPNEATGLSAPYTPKT